MSAIRRGAGHDVRPQHAPKTAARQRTDPILALQRSAGNRAVGQLLARKTKKETPLPPLDPQADLSFALKYVNDYYEGVQHIIELKDKVQAQAIENYKKFGELKDPPSIADAVLAEIFNQVLGLVPGGKLVTAAVSAGVFAVQFAQLEKDLEGIPGVSIEDEAKKGPSEKTKEKVGKVVGHGKTAIDAGKAIVGAGIKAAEERAAASRAEAAAKESAAMHGNRIGEWQRATELAQTQEQAITDELEVAVRKGADRGKLKEIVVKRLGPIPKPTKELKEQLESKYELQLYRQKLTLATERVRYVDQRGYTSTSTRLELVGGGEPSSATLRRIAQLLGMPWLAMYPGALAGHLGVGHSSRERWKKLNQFEPTRPGAGG